MTTKQFTLRLPQDLHAAFKAKVALTRKSMGEMLDLQNGRYEDCDYRRRAA